MTLEAVTDSGIPVVAIAELGILRDVQLDEDDSLVATITPIYLGCPAIEQIADNVSHVLRMADVGAYRVHPVLSLAWMTDWITVEGQRELRNFGIAPPAYMVEVDGAWPVRLIRPAQGEHITCLQYGLHDTVLISAFGSTACKALYRCRACRKPFDYFKPY